MSDTTLTTLIDNCIKYPFWTLFIPRTREERSSVYPLLTFTVWCHIILSSLCKTREKDTNLSSIYWTPTIESRLLILDTIWHTLWTKCLINSCLYKGSDTLLSLYSLVIVHLLLELQAFVDRKWSITFWFDKNESKKLEGNNRFWLFVYLYFANFTCHRWSNVNIVKSKRKWEKMLEQVFKVAWFKQSKCHHQVLRL